MKFENETNESFYGVKEVPNVKITAVYYDGSTVDFLCDAITNFTFENLVNVIQCSMDVSVVSGSFWTEIFNNDLKNNFKSYRISAITYRRNASTGEDEKFILLDDFVFDEMRVQYTLHASGEPCNPKFTFVKYIPVKMLN